MWINILYNRLTDIYPIQLLHVDGGAGADVLGPNPPKRRWGLTVLWKYKLCIYFSKL